MAQVSAPKPVLEYRPPAQPRLERLPPELWRVFGWMLWGDFVITLMERVVPSLLPIMLEERKQSNTAIAVITGTLPQIFTLILLPILGYQSDQLRTRWGRRIPFMLVSIPFIALALCAIPYSPALADWLDSRSWLRPLLDRTHLSGLVIAFGLTYSLYRIFDAVCSAGFAWLTPDVVPARFMGRFQSSMRVVSQAGLFVFFWFCLGMAEQHPKGLFVGAAIVYALGFSIVCLKVKEPAYPPPQEGGKILNPISILRSYGRECFRHPIYLWLYGLGIMYGFSQLAGNLYDMLFLKKTLGLELPQMGRLMAIATIAVAPLAFVCGHVLDRWKAQRVIVWFAVAGALAKLAGFFLIVGPKSYIAVTIGNNAIAFFWGVTFSTFTITMIPRDRFAQFAACGGVIGGLVALVTPTICGAFFDYVQDYRYVYLWPAVLMLVVAAILWRIKRYWLKFGGPDNYVAP